MIELRATSEASKESEGIQYITLRIACFEHLKLNLFFFLNSCRLHGLYKWQEIESSETLMG